MKTCWNTLRQTVHRGADRDSMYAGRPNGTYALGHILARSDEIDFPINQKDYTPIPPEDEIYISRKSNFTWGINKGNRFSGNAALDLSSLVSAKTEAMFKKVCKKYTYFDQTEVITFDPTIPYVRDVLQSPSVAEYMRKHHMNTDRRRRWTLYMISGMFIAKPSSQSERQADSISGGGAQMGVNLPDPTGTIPGRIGASAGFSIGSNYGTSYSMTHEDSYVWAVRLIKIEKGLGRSDWKRETLYVEENDRQGSATVPQSATEEEEVDSVREGIAKELETMESLYGYRKSANDFEIVVDPAIDGCFISPKY